MVPRAEREAEKEAEREVEREEAAQEANGVNSNDVNFENTPGTAGGSVLRSGRAKPSKRR